MLDRARWARLADTFAILVAVVLPWSISATEILIALWLVALLPTLDGTSLRAALTRPAGYLPVVLCLLAVLGMLWADASLDDRLGGLRWFLRLLVIPLLFVHFRHSDRGAWVLIAFLGSATALLVLSGVTVLWPALWVRDPPGVPVKDYIAQSGEFTICAFALAAAAVTLWHDGWRGAALAALGLALLFMADVLYVATGRTTLVVIVLLLVVFAFWHFRWQRALGLVAAAVVLGAIVWASSPYLRERVTSLVTEVETYRSEGPVSSAGIRLELWRKSAAFVAEAPLIGHGTGSIGPLFRRAELAGSMLGDVVNPHNQTFVVAIQLGLIGVAVLYAMWVAHLALFRGGGSVVAFIGLVVVLQNAVGSVFNSHLSDATQGWFYVFGVGVAGGMVWRVSDLARSKAGAP